MRTTDAALFHKLYQAAWASAVFKVQKDFQKCGKLLAPFISIHCACRTFFHHEVSTLNTPIFSSQDEDMEHVFFLQSKFAVTDIKELVRIHCHSF
jgi:hypothetical protein